MDFVSCFALKVVKEIIQYQLKHSISGKGKGKAIPLQPWTGPKRFRRLRFPDFKTIGT